MKVTATALPGVLLLEPRTFGDHRGFFLEAFQDDRFRAHGLPAEVRQVNHSRSARGVLRGLHYQLHHPQGKLVTVAHGEIFDVAVDIRRGSPTFGESVGVPLRAGEPRHLWVPPGFAHGFCVLSDSADVVYLCTGHLYDPADDRGIRWDDPRLAIRWPVADPVLSARDAALAPLSDDRDDLPRYEP